MEILKSLGRSAKFITSGSIGVIPTDTIYGLAGSALSKKSVRALYTVKGRNERKPFIILIARYQNLKDFGVILSVEQRKFLNQEWPGPVSVVLPVLAKKWEYLHRGSRSLAFRMPAKPDLRRLLLKTGPLCAPSANPEGKLPAESIAQAQAYFNDKIDFYVDAGLKKGKPSKLVRMYLNGNIEILRK
jgi:L-threonylcarbamoyladenylate synthase